MSSFGPGLALLLLVLTPFLWSLPVSLAMAELAAAMPDEGGYVTWVRRAFGPYWGFQVGWWSWIDSFVDVAVYPALFVEYVKFWYPTMTSLERWLLAVLFIVVLTVLNVLGVRPTGRAAVVLAVLALAAGRAASWGWGWRRPRRRRGGRSWPRGARSAPRSVSASRSSCGTTRAGIRPRPAWARPRRRSTPSGARSSWPCR